MIKYGTYTVYKCSKCGAVVKIPLHLEREFELEKLGKKDYCKHIWEVQEKDETPD